MTGGEGEKTKRDEEGRGGSEPRAAEAHYVPDVMNIVGAALCEAFN